MMKIVALGETLYEETPAPDGCGYRPLAEEEIRLICTNCWDTITVPDTTVLEVIGGPIKVECQKCPACETITFTQAQSEAVDRKRRELEGYVLGHDENGDFITCKACGYTSHHPKDVREKFCGHCDKFH